MPGAAAPGAAAPGGRSGLALASFGDEGQGEKVSLAEVTRAGIDN
jgi:hypothetical protein